MSSWYVRSAAAGTGAGTSWANACTTVAAAIALGAAGDTYYISEDHAETTASALTVTFKGTVTNPDFAYCVNHAGSVPPVAADLTTGGSISTTGANGLTIAGSLYAYGLTLNAGSVANSASLSLAGTAGCIQIWENSTFVLNNTSTTSLIIPIANSSTGNSMLWMNCSVTFGSVSQSLGMSGGSRGTNFTWRNTSAPFGGAIFPTTLMTPTYRAGLIVFDGLDLSSLGSGKTIVGSGVADVDIINCKLNASVTVAATPSGLNAGKVRLINCNSSGVAQRNELREYQGTLTTETTIIRTAGASDGTTPYSWKIVSTANAKRQFPFETFEGAIWNATTGSSKTLTFHCVTDNVTLQDADIFVEVEYLGSSATPVTTLISSAPATQLTAGSNLTSDSGEAWTTTGLTTPVKQKFSVTFTPQMAGPIRWKVKVAKASTTVYVDPNPDLV